MEGELAFSGEDMNTTKGKTRSPKTVYLCSFGVFFSDILKEPNLRFESAQMTLSKRLFDELIKAL